MKCPRCQAENPAGQRFCGECGVRLASVCAACLVYPLRRATRTRRHLGAGRAYSMQLRLLKP